MSELRSGLRRARASPVVLDKTRTNPPPPDPLLATCVKTRAAAAREAADTVASVKTRAAAAREAVDTVVEVKPQKNKKKNGENEGLGLGLWLGLAPAPEPAPVIVFLKSEEEEEEEEKAMADGSGGLSANKVTGQEEEGNTAPFPDRVQVGGSPLYKVERKLGKGGFGQIFVGRPVSGGTERISGPGATEVALKFEHRNSKGCNYGPSYEWQVYRWQSRCA
ncbi:putative kinase, ATP binding protein [Helianthus debilis subsp. tardiflorus]